jgi:hypothetical protein
MYAYPKCDFCHCGVYHIGDNVMLWMKILPTKVKMKLLGSCVGISFILMLQGCEILRKAWTCTTAGYVNQMNNVIKPLEGGKEMIG